MGRKIKEMIPDQKTAGVTATPGWIKNKKLER